MVDIVKQYTRPSTGEVDTDVNIFSVIEERASRTPDDPIAAVKDGKGGWDYVTAAQYRDRIVAVAKGMLAKGLRPGDRIAILSATRIEWAVIDLAVMSIGGVTVPIYETNSPLQIRTVLNNAEVRAIFVENDAQKEKVESIKDDCPALGDVYEIDAADVNILDAIAELGKGVSDEEWRERNKAAHGDQTCTIVYTSGSSGTPKGVELTHANFVYITYAGIRSMPDIAGTDPERPRRLLMFLPLAHVFARYIQFYCYGGNGCVGFSSDFSTILDDFRSFRPTFILSVPRVFEKVYNAASQMAGGGKKGEIFHKAAVLAREASDAQQAGRRLPLGKRIRYGFYRKAVYSKILDVFGGQAEFAVSGGAPLDDSISRFFNGCGLPLLEGFGMTETTAPASVNMEHGYKLGTVGKPLEGLTFAVDKDNHLYIKGGSVMKGYYKNPQATAEALQDGWLVTGDLASIDDEGFITITGRSKDIIITAGGKNVAPGAAEATIMTSPVVDQCLVIGDRRPFVAALVTLDLDSTNAWLKSMGGEPCATLEEAAANPVVRQEVDRIVDKANESVSRAESVRKFEIVPDVWNQENGMLTASLKTRRSQIIHHYADLIDKQIYVPRKKQN